MYFSVPGPGDAQKETGIGDGFNLAYIKPCAVYNFQIGEYIYQCVLRLGQGISINPFAETFLKGVMFSNYLLSTNMAVQF